MVAVRPKEGAFNQYIITLSRKLSLCLDTPDPQHELTGALGWRSFQPTKPLKEELILRGNTDRTFVEKSAIMARVGREAKAQDHVRFNREAISQSVRAGQKEKRVTGEVFLTLLETRLDNVVYRLGFAKTRQAARQFVNHGHILVNGIKVDIPSYQVSVGDEIGFGKRHHPDSLPPETWRGLNIISPPWVEVNADSLQGTVSRFPQSDELEKSVNVNWLLSSTADNYLSYLKFIQ